MLPSNRHYASSISSAIEKMTQTNLASQTTRHHELQCMEIWSGNESIENFVTAPGMEAWVFSQPYHGDLHGGDVHHLSLCVGGIVTRIALADVAGHGQAVAETSKTLRQLLRRFMNAKSQNRLVVELNRRFTEMEQGGTFATAVIATYLSHQRRMLLTNAGHPRPLVFRQAINEWQFLSDEAIDHGYADNLPLGLDGACSYQNYSFSLEANDWVLLYTDAFTEAMDPKEKLLGEMGLIELVRQIPLSTNADEFGRKLIWGVQAYSQGAPTEDDATLIIMRFTKNRRVPGVMERLRGYGKVIRSGFA